MTNDNIIRVPRVVQTGPSSALSIWPADETGIATTEFHSLAEPITPAGGRKLRSDLTEEQKAEALRIGRIEFKSAGVARKR